MQRAMEDLMDECEELRECKEARGNDRKDSAVYEHEDYEKLRGENRVLQSDFAASRNDCTRLQSENDELRTSILAMEHESREAQIMQKSFEELQAAHEQLKKSNETLEKYLAMAVHDVQFQEQACKELERSRDALRDEMDDANIELKALEKTISNVAQEFTYKDDKIAALSTQLEQLRESACELGKTHNNLTFELEETKEELVQKSAILDCKEDYERDFFQLQADYEVVCHQLKELEDRMRAEEMRAAKDRDKDLQSFTDGLSDGFMLATLILLIALGIYGVCTGKLG
ncbi:uncharacterized protein RCC_06546 [Ramularia collo-cygni]|uniref:Uncharacterized protein n=1 Tax=Ramularia collo-cygni TaxID=112498 RepID=A0A2D3UYZ0_9PEZI|nr:uncharacterized protein RCC_06546 [Ramularia collo-cygni]CZT20688.1 uncharacterized protein RCC_06546 [Ramularia collo-cygni]